MSEIIWEFRTPHLCHKGPCSVRVTCDDLLALSVSVWRPVGRTARPVPDTCLVMRDVTSRQQFAHIFQTDIGDLRIPEVEPLQVGKLF
jgi:hypothetical protein